MTKTIFEEMGGTYRQDEVLFEARARYLYTYAPVFCILAAIGIEKLNSEIKKKSRL